jgi:catechol 2,3-dioxygenase-like lactoylglutathione lyase family enzyme
MDIAMATEDQSWPDEEGFVEVAALDCVSIGVADLGRAADFYVRLFAFCRLRDDRRAGDARVILGRGGRPSLVLVEDRMTADATRLIGTVASLERAREVVWDLGISVIRDIDEPAATDALRAGRSFVIRDPDGNEVEFIDQCYKKQS